MKLNLSQHKIKILSSYLSKRFKEPSVKSGLSIVYDVTYFCNLSCRGCAVNAKIHNSKHISDNKLELKLKYVYKLLEKIKKHIEEKNITPFFINFGGGEPFLRADFKEILRYASCLFGNNSVAIDTNGTFATIDDLKAIKDYLCGIGISIDGLEGYHNKWRSNKKIPNPYSLSMNLIKEALKDRSLKNIIEVSSVVTKENIRELPKLISNLNDIGVKYYSVHRNFPVGRMAKLDYLLPDASDYLELALIIADANEKYEIDCHFHHSLESIYASLLLGYDTYIADKVVGNPDSKSSFGIDPKGNIYFDPWCMVPPWNELKGGNVLQADFNFGLLSSGQGMGMLSIAKNYSLKENRCDSCEVNCSGGCRIAASANYLKKIDSYNLADQLIGLSKIDPACPKLLI
jgi:MoaA/NifB/PqqE/SkfB family radical SAM enzyme